MLRERFLGFPFVLHTDLDPAECARRLQAHFVDARGMGRGTATETAAVPRGWSEDFVLRTTLRRANLRDSRLFLTVRLVPEGDGTAVTCRHSAFLRRWARNVTIAVLFVGIALLALIVIRAIVGWRYLDWLLFGLPLVVFALAQLNAPFTARARQEREPIARYLARLLDAR